MNPSIFLLALGNELVANQQLSAWCQQMFGRDLHVIVGFDVHNPPEEDLYPFVGLIDVVETVGESNSYLEYELEMVVGILDGEVKVDGRLIIYSGLPKCSELKSMVELSLFGSSLVMSGEAAGDETPLSFLPAFLGFSTLKFQLFKSTRAPLR